MNSNLKTEESLLRAWLDMTLHIRGNRIVNALSFNEIVICNILYQSMCDDGEAFTATDIGQRTKLLKSQLNRILTSMEEKGLIERYRSASDKRKVYLKLCEDRIHVYLEEHAKVMQLMHVLCQRLGEEKVKVLTTLLEEAVAVVDGYEMQNESVIGDGSI
jgi:DNA-binding MarR family transcriptional regulator